MHVWEHVASVTEAEKKQSFFCESLICASVRVTLKSVG